MEHICYLLNTADVLYSCYLDKVAKAINLMSESIHLCHNGVELGAFPQDQIESMLKGKVIAPDTLAWKAGETEWRPLKEIINTSIASKPPIPIHTVTRKKTDTQRLFEYIKGAETSRASSNTPSKNAESVSSGDVALTKEHFKAARKNYQIAYYQQRVNWGITLLLGCVAITVIFPSLSESDLIGYIFIAPLSIGFIYFAYCFMRLKFAIYHWLAAIVAILFVIIPGGIILETIVSCRVVRNRFKKQGIPIGLLGVSRETMDELREQYNNGAA